MKVFTIDYTADAMKVAGFESLQDATPTEEGWTRVVVRDGADLDPLEESLLLRIYNNMKPPKKRTMKAFKTHESAVALVLACLEEPKTDLTSVPQENIDGAQAEDSQSAYQPKEDTSSATKEAKMASKKRAPTKKAKAAKAARKTGPRGEKMKTLNGMLTRKSGCTRADILEATGWKAVSVQQICKGLGLKLTKEKDEKAPGKPYRYYGAAKAS